MQLIPSWDPFKWRKLQGQFDQFATVVNANEPLEGDGIRIVETSTGKLISVTENAQGANTSGGGGGGGGGAGTPINQITVTGVKWMDLGVVDPISCEQSTFSVLVNTGIDSDTATFNLQTPILA